MGHETKDIVNQITEKVAQSKGVDQVELLPLGRRVDTDALQTLLNSSEEIRVKFDYAGFAIVVTTENVSVQEK